MAISDHQPTLHPFHRTVAVAVCNAQHGQAMARRLGQARQVSHKPSDAAFLDRQRRDPPARQGMRHQAHTQLAT